MILTAFVSRSGDSDCDWSAIAVVALAYPTGCGVQEVENRRQRTVNIVNSEQIMYFCCSA